MPTISGEGRHTASLWHSGQWSALYSISSTGTVWDESYRSEAELDLEKELERFDWDQDNAIELYQGLEELLVEVKAAVVENPSSEEDEEEEGCWCGENCEPGYCPG